MKKHIMSIRGFLAAVAALFIGGGFAAEPWNETTEAFSSLAAQTGLKVYKLTEEDEGAELTSGIYYLDGDLDFYGDDSNSIREPGGNGLKIATNATVYIYIPDGVTLSAFGGAGKDAHRGVSPIAGTFAYETNTLNAIEYVRHIDGVTSHFPSALEQGENGLGASGGGAGILVPTNANLIIFGKGTVHAEGGVGGASSGGGTGAQTILAAGSIYSVQNSVVKSTRRQNHKWANFAWASDDTDLRCVEIRNPTQDATDTTLMNYLTVLVGAGGCGGGGGGGGGAGIGSNGASGGAGAEGSLPNVVWPKWNEWQKGTPIEPYDAKNVPTDGKEAVGLGNVHIFGVTRDVAGGEGGYSGTPIQPQEFSAAVARQYCKGTEVDALSGEVLYETENIAVHTNMYVSYFHGADGGDGGEGGHGAGIGCGGSGGQGGYGGKSGSCADTFYCTRGQATDPRAAQSAQKGADRQDIEPGGEDYPYNIVTFLNAPEGEGTANYSLTVGTQLPMPGLNKDKQVVGLWEVTGAATNLPPAMGGEATLTGLALKGATFAPNATLATLGFYGNATLKPLLRILDDPDAANVEKVYDGLPTNITVTVTNAVPVADLKTVYSTDPTNPNSWKESLGFVDVGKYKVYYLLTAPDYLSVTNFAFVTITKRSAKVTAGSDSKTYDGTPLTCDKWTPENFVTGEGVTSATLTGTITDAGSVSNDFGEITYTSTTKLDNYTITKVPGTLTVKPIDGAKVTVTGNTGTKTYNGKEQRVEGIASIAMSNEVKAITSPAFDPSWVAYDATKAVAKGKKASPNKYMMGLTPDDFKIDDQHAQNYTNLTFTVIDGWLKINPRDIGDQEIAVEGPNDVVYSGLAQEPTDVIVTDAVTGELLEEGTDYEITGYANNTNVTDAALLYVKGKGNYEDTRTRTFKITPVPITVTPNAIELTYGDPVPAYTYRMTGFVNGEKEEEVVTTSPVFSSPYAKGSKAGTYTIAMVSPAAAKNYSFTYETALLTVKSATINYRADNIHETYDGAPHSVEVEVLEPAEGATVKFSYDEGESWGDQSLPYVDVTNGVTVLVCISAENYETVTGRVSVVIDPRTLNLSTATRRKTYDGAPLQSTNVVAESFASGEGCVYSEFGSQTEVGVGKATFAYAPKDGTKLSNYAITTSFGDLIVEPSEAEIQIVSADGTWVYDPALVPFKKPVYEVVHSNLFAEGDYPVVQFKSDAELSEVGEKENGFIYKVWNATKGDVTGNYKNLSARFGLLKVTPAKLPFTAEDYIGTYDGAEHGPTVTPDAGVTGATVTYLTDPHAFADATNAVVTFVISAPNYQTTTGTAVVAISPCKVTFASPTKMQEANGTALTFDASEITTTGAIPAGEGFAFGDFASITEVGSTKATFTATAREGTKLSNYAITYEYGTLAVYSADPKDVTLIAASETFLYDGVAHSNHTWTTAKALPGGWKIESVKFSSMSVITEPGEVENLIVSAEVVGADGKKYTPTYISGVLRVKARPMPKATVESVVTVYDGKGHSITVTPDASVSGASVTYSETGAAESFVAANPVYTNVNNMGFTAYRVQYKVSAPGYEDDTGFGTVLITQRVVKVSSGDANWIYLAKPLTCEESTPASGSVLPVTGDTLYTTFKNSQTDVGKTENLFECAVTNGAGVDVTGNYSFDKKTGWLEVEKFALNISYAAFDKVYDGKTNATCNAGGTTYIPEELPGNERITFAPEGMDFFFETPEVDPNKPVHAYGYDAEKNLVFADGAKRGNYDVTFNPDTRASILLAEPPALDPDDGFVPGVGPFFDHNPPSNYPPAPTDGGNILRLSNYDYIECYDGLGHTLLTNDLHEAIRTNDWIHGEYGIAYSFDSKTWEKDLAAFTFTNVVSTSFWYRVTAPDAHHNYSNYYHAVGVTITQRVVTVTAQDASKTYGEPDPALTCTTNGLVVATDMKAGTLTREPGENWTPDGTSYAITEDEAFDAGDNYKIDFVPGKFTIRRKNAEECIALGAAGPYFYSGAERKPEPSVSDTRTTPWKTVGADEFYYSYKDNTDASENALVSATFTNNYYGTVGTNFTIRPRTVTLTSAGDTWPYDGKPHGTNVVTATAYDGADARHGFVPGEGYTANATGSVTNVDDSGKENNPFTYSLNANTKEGNYSIDKKLGDLAITPGKIDNGLRFTAEGPKDVIYTGLPQTPTDIAVTDATTQKTLVEGTDYVIAGYADNVAVTTAAKVTLQGVGNYTNVLVRTFKILPATITVTADNREVTYGAPAPTYSNTMTGFVNGERQEDVVRGTVTYACAYEPGVTPAGAAVTIVPDVSGLSADNYVFQAANGTLTVKPATITYRADNIQKTYDGAPHAVVVDVIEPTEGATVKFSYDGGASWGDQSLPYVDVTNGVVVKVRIDAPNYASVTGDVTVVIDPRTLTLSTATRYKTYNGEKLWSTNVVGETFVPGESFDYAGFNGEWEVGVHRQAATFTYSENGTAKKSNYAITTRFGDLVIYPSDEQIQIVSEDGTWVYDPALVPFSTNAYHVVNSNLFAQGDYPVVTFSPEATISAVGTRENVFTYTVTNDVRGDVTASYTNLSKRFGLLTVTPAPLSVVATNYLGVYDGAAHGPTVVPGVAGATVTYLTDPHTFTDVTNATVDYVVSAANYQTKTGTAYVVIEPIPLTFTSADKAKVFDTYPLTFGAEGVTNAFGKGVTAFPAGEGFTLGDFASITEVGQTPAAFSYTANAETKIANYDVTTVFGTLTVVTNDPKRITVQAGSADFTFDGAKHTHHEATPLNLPAGYRMVEPHFTEESAIEYPGTVANVVDGAKILDAQGKDVTALFDLDYQPGTLLMKKAQMPEEEVENVVTVYDGTGYSITVTPGATLTPASVTYSETGASASFVSVNPAYTNVNNEGFRAYRVNYKITARGYEDATGFGTVTITQRIVQVASETRAKTYDATPLTWAKAALTGGSLADGDAISYTFKGSQTDAGQTENLFECAVANAAGEDVSANYCFDKTMGWLKVDPIALTVNFAANDKVYDGQTNATCNASGTTYSPSALPGEERVTFDPTGMTFFFADPNVGEWTVTAYGFTMERIAFEGGAMSGNYAVTFVPTTAARIIKAGPPDLDPDPKDEFPPEAGPFIDEDFPKKDPPAMTNEQGQVRHLSNYDYIWVYDGLGHTIDTNALHTAICTNEWIHGTFGQEGGYGISYSADRETWTEDLASFTFTNVIATSFWYCVKTPFKSPNYTNYAHAVGIAITQRVARITFEAADKEYDETTVATCTATNFANVVAGESFDLATGDLGSGAMTFAFDTPDVGKGKTVTASGYSDERPIPGPDTLKSNYSFDFVRTTTAAILKQRIDEFAFVSTTTNCVYNGKPHEPVVVVENKSGNIVPPSAYSVGYYLNTNATDEVLAYAVVTLTNNNYSGVITNDFKIKPRTVTITTQSAHFTYNGKGHSCTNGVEISPYADDPATDEHTGFVPGEGFITNAFTVVTNATVAPVPNVLSYTRQENTLPQNYTITPAWGELTVGKGFIPVEPPGDDPEPPKPPTDTPWAYAQNVTKTYDGLGTNITAKVVGTADGSQPTITYSVNQTDYAPWAGLQLTNVVFDAEGQVTSQKVWYAVAETPNYAATNGWAWVLIRPVEVTVTSKSMEWTWDGKEHSYPECTVDPETLPPPLTKDQIVCENFATITDIGTNDNTFICLWASTVSAVDARNYTLKTVYGKISVVARQDAMLAVQNLSWLFDEDTGMHLAMLDVACTNKWLENLESAAFVVTDALFKPGDPLYEEGGFNYRKVLGDSALGDVSVADVRISAGMTNRFFDITAKVKAGEHIGPTEQIARTLWPDGLSESALADLRKNTPEVYSATMDGNDWIMPSNALTYVVWKTNGREYWLPVLASAELRRYYPGTPVETAPDPIFEKVTYDKNAGITFVPLTGPVPTATLSLGRSLGLPHLTAASKPICQITACAFDASSVSGTVQTQADGETGVPSKSAKVVLLGAKSPEGPYAEVTVVETDGEGNFSAPLDGVNSFFKVKIETGNDFE